MGNGMYIYRTETPVQLTPHSCPKCNATGWLGYDPARPPLTNVYTANQSSWPCDVCERGIIWSRLAPTPERRTAGEGTNE